MYYPQVHTSVVRSIAKLLPRLMSISRLRYRTALSTEFSTFPLFSWNYTFALWRAWAVPLLDGGCAVGRAAVPMTSAALLPTLERAKGQKETPAPERRESEFFHSCLFHSVSAGCRPGYLERGIWRVIWRRREHSRWWVKSLEDVHSELCGAECSARAH